MNNKTLNFFIKHSNYNSNQILGIKKINNGFTNQSFKVYTDDKKEYIVRFSGNDFLDREVEKHIYKSLDINLIYFNKNGDLIRDWINGKHFKRWNNKKLILFVDELKKINNIKFSKIKKFDPYIFFNLLDKQKDKEIINEYRKLVNKYRNEKLCTCHSDLNPTNILYDNKKKKIIIIDYEWVKLNNIYWELANFSREGLSEKQMIFLLDKYGLANYKKFKDYLIMTCLYAYQWSLSVNKSKEIFKYQKSIFKRLNKIKKMKFIKKG